jgi:hypothetical protein
MTSSAQAELTEGEKKGNWYFTFVSDSQNQKREIVVWSESISVWRNLGKKLKTQTPR